MPNHKGHTPSATHSPMARTDAQSSPSHNPALGRKSSNGVPATHRTSAGAHTILVEMSQNSAPGTKSNPRVYIRTCTCDSGFRVYLRSPDPYCPSSICLLQDCLGYFRAFNVTRVGRPGLQRPRAVPFIREGRWMLHAGGLAQRMQLRAEMEVSAPGANIEFM